MNNSFHHEGTKTRRHKRRRRTRNQYQFFRIPRVLVPSWLLFRPFLKLFRTSSHAMPLALLGVLLLAGVLRLLLWAGPLHQLANDEVEYVTVARDLLAGRGWVFYESYHWLRAPLYNLFLAASLWLAHGDLHAAALPNIALSVANVYLAYRLALHLVGRRAALLAALITAVLWTNATFASLYMAETLFTFCFLIGWLALVGVAGGASAPLAEGRSDRQNPTAVFAIATRSLRPSGRGGGRAGRSDRVADDNQVPRAPEGRNDRVADDNQVPPVWRLLRPSMVVGVVVAGVFLGLATLTRSASMFFLPVIAAWLLYRGVRSQTSGGRRQKAAFLPPLVFLVAACLTIAPWTVRNYVAYGRIIPVETGLSYNIWVFNEPRESIEEIHRTLEQIANPAERSDYAMARGTARLREDPAILLCKLWPNWVYLTRVKPIEDRFVQESYYLDVHLPQFTAALILDDLLYLVVALAGIAGLAAYRGAGARGLSVGGSPKALCVLWLLYMVATMLLTHGEARYRHFLFPLLMPYAAWALTTVATRMGLRNKKDFSFGGYASKPPLALRFFVPLLIAMLLLAVIPTYPVQWAATNLARGWQQQWGDFALWRGDGAAAVERYTRAAEIANTTDAYRRLGDTAQSAADLVQAEVAYRESTRLARLWAAPAASLGNLLRTQERDDEARAAYAAPYLKESELVDWSWRHVLPAPRTVVDAGGGLDFGYLDGVYDAEVQQGATARWTNGRALLRLAMPPDGGLLRLRLAAPHPGDHSAAATICVATRCETIALARTWRTYTLLLPAAPAHAPLEIRSPTFDGGNGRTLGVLIDTASIRVP